MGYTRHCRLDLIRVVAGHTKSVRAVVFATDEPYLVSASSDNTCKIWSAVDGLLLDTKSMHTHSLCVVY
jgi:WD40 repeat protein